jgi:hypothetical protein
MHMQKINTQLLHQRSCTRPANTSAQPDRKSYCRQSGLLRPTQQLALSMRQQRNLHAALMQCLHQMQNLVLATAPLSISIYLANMHYMPIIKFTLMPTLNINS